MDRHHEGSTPDEQTSASQPLENTAHQVLEDLKKGSQELAKILDSNIEENTGFLGQISDSKKTKTSLRLTYEAQARVIEKRVGSLEQVRKRLGLSQRKISQLLMVDPSAWTRWTRPGATAPPWVYRTLEWYLMLEEKHPGTSSFWLGSMGVTQNKTMASEVEKTSRALNKLKHETQTQFRRVDTITKKRNLLGWAIALIFFGMFLGQLLIR